MGYAETLEKTMEVKNNNLNGETTPYCGIINAPKKQTYDKLNLAKLDSAVKESNYTWEKLENELGAEKLWSKIHKTKSPSRSLVEKICDLIGCNVGYFYNMNGVTMKKCIGRRKSKISKEIADQIIELYKDPNIQTVTILRQFNISGKTMYNIIDGNNIPRRKKK